MLDISKPIPEEITSEVVQDAKSLRETINLIERSGLMFDADSKAVATDRLKAVFSAEIARLIAKAHYEGGVELLVHILDAADLMKSVDNRFLLVDTGMEEISKKLYERDLEKYISQFKILIDSDKTFDHDSAKQILDSISSIFYALNLLKLGTGLVDANMIATWKQKLDEKLPTEA